MKEPKKIHIKDESFIFLNFIDMRIIIRNILITVILKDWTIYRKYIDSDFRQIKDYYWGCFSVLMDWNEEWYLYTLEEDWIEYEFRSSKIKDIIVSKTWNPKINITF